MKFELASGLAVLERTPAGLRELLNGLPEAWIRGTEGSQTFSAFDVVGHLIDGEETDWVPRAKIILERGPDPRFEPYDRFRHWTRNVGRTLPSLLDEFRDLRAANMALVRSWNLEEAQLELPGNHPTLGVVSLRQLLAAWVVHDLGHIAQISRVMAKQYKEEVGPWVPFMPVLTDHEVPRS
ncbi:MAG: DinB family protein [Gemmatimonadota bacterium]